MLTPTEEKSMMSFRDVAKTFAVSEWTVRAWVKNGTIPKPVRLGPRVQRFRRTDIDRVMREGGKV